MYVPMQPEAETDPKRVLIDLAKRSKKRYIREDIIPLGQAPIGPNYNSRLQEFVFTTWDLTAARQNADSLDRAARCLEKFTPSYSKSK